MVVMPSSVASEVQSFRFREWMPEHELRPDRAACTPAIAGSEVMMMMPVEPLMMLMTGMKSNTYRLAQGHARRAVLLQ
jgi:hypothetical protein